MFMQFSLIALIALAVPSVFGTLYGYSGQTCAGTAKVYQNAKGCIALSGVDSYRVTGDILHNWVLFSDSNCTSEASEMIGSDDGCEGSIKITFTARSALYSPY